ncbi:hypothetical protein CLIB1423_07S00188 [[Candida] railenensis]|uniref:Uncharacterized protein n=1 Tax=[Candida] railenensis TaxID=45579 RepID=A0A9P0QPZ2_9ASCO|nr:hypothetical protein CLIB1423_07S00188 [[Candida] railenensis]
MKSHIFAPFCMYKDVDLYNCSFDTCKNLEAAFADLAKKISEVKEKNLDTSADAEIDIFELLSSLVRSCTFNEWYDEKDALTSNVLPCLLCYHFISPSLFKRIRPKIKDGSFQRVLYEMCQSMEASDVKIGILSYYTYLDLNHHELLVLKSPFAYSLIPSLQICKDLLGNLLEVIENDTNSELDNVSLFECLQTCISSSSVRTTRELMSIMIKNDEELLGKLDGLLSRPQVSRMTELNGRCIELLLDRTILTLISNGIDLAKDGESILGKRWKANKGKDCRSFNRFSPQNPESVQNSLVFIMECVEHGPSLEIMNSKSLSLYYFLSMRNLNSELNKQKLEVYNQFNRTRCTISLNHLLINTIFNICTEVIESKKKPFEFPSVMKRHFDIFMLPPMAKANYLVETSEESLEIKMSNRNQNLRHISDTLLLTWNMLIEVFPEEFYTLPGLADSKSTAIKILNNTLDLFLSIIFSSSYLILNDSINIGSDAFKLIGTVILKRALSTFFNLSMSFYHSEAQAEMTLKAICLINYADKLCNASLEYIPVVEKVLSLVDLVEIFDSDLSKAKLLKFVTQYDHSYRSVKVFLSGGELIEPTSTSSTDTYTSISSDTASTKVPIKDFMIYYEDEKLEALSGDFNNQSLGSSSSSSHYAANHQAKRNELFSANRNSLH